MTNTEVFQNVFILTIENVGIGGIVSVFFSHETGLIRASEDGCTWTLSQTFSQIYRVGENQVHY